MLWTEWKLRMVLKLLFCSEVGKPSLSYSLHFAAKLSCLASADKPNLNSPVIFLAYGEEANPLTRLIINMRKSLRNKKNLVAGLTQPLIFMPLIKMPYPFINISPKVPSLYLVITWRRPFGQSLTACDVTVSYVLIYYHIVCISMPTWLHGLYNWAQPYVIIVWCMFVGMARFRRNLTKAFVQMLRSEASWGNVQLYSLILSWRHDRGRS